jgi:hypothetical protein
MARSRRGDARAFRRPLSLSLAVGTVEFCFLDLPACSMLQHLPRNTRTRVAVTCEYTCMDSRACHPSVHLFTFGIFRCISCLICDCVRASATDCVCPTADLLSLVLPVPSSPHSSPEHRLAHSAPLVLGIFCFSKHPQAPSPDLFVAAQEVDTQRKRTPACMFDHLISMKIASIRILEVEPG